MPSLLRVRHGEFSIISPLVKTQLHSTLWHGHSGFFERAGRQIIEKGIRHIVSMIIIVTTHSIVSPRPSVQLND